MATFTGQVKSTPCKTKWPSDAQIETARSAAKKVALGQAASWAAKQIAAEARTCLQEGANPYRRDYCVPERRVDEGFRLSWNDDSAQPTLCVDQYLFCTVAEFKASFTSALANEGLNVSWDKSAWRRFTISPLSC
jgi:hypothetical protein